MSRKGTGRLNFLGFAFEVQDVSPGVVLALAAVTVAVSACMPFALIWSLNTLFGLGIAYNFWTWLAMIVLNVALISSRSGD